MRLIVTIIYTHEERIEDMINVFIITLREGVEIAVVLAIILAYLKQLGQMKDREKCG